ncbi:MAG: hypothetical protein KBH45_14830 [Verrucomicrobia bacterium]|nr:hypothetical protein [Verrucomicrobiota bacterium]
MSKHLINQILAASLLLLAAPVAVAPAQAQTDGARQDIMMVMEADGPKKPSTMSVKDKADLMLRRVTRAGQKLLVYSTPAITNDPILPWSDLPPLPSDSVALRACRGEYEPASFVAFPIDGDLTVEVTATDLSGTVGNIPSASVDIRVVKCWYQAGGGEGYSQAPKYVEEVGEKDIMILENTPVDEGRRLLTPELLLKDDDLVRTEKWYRQNFVKLKYPDGKTRWLWASAPRVVFPDGKTVEPWIMSPDTVGKAEDSSVETKPIKDAATLQPVTIPKRTSKQFWITVHVPKDAKTGDYAGKIELRSKGQLLETLALKLEVLPFELEPNYLESSIYLHFFGSKGFIGLELDEKGQGTVGADVRSVAQYRAELQNLLAHGVDNPTESIPLEQLEIALQVRKEVGMKMDTLYHTFEGLGGWEVKPVDVERLKKVVALAKKYGYKEVYLYGLDEAQGERLKASRPELEKLHQAGGKIFMAGLTPDLGGDSLHVVGDLQDLMVMSYIPRKEFADAWHAKGHKIMSYANPQSGFEKPETYRRNYGLLLDYAGYDGGMTFSYYWFGWNDFNIWPPYRDHMFVYPTVDGVIDTIAWEGYREGIDDLRYLATLRKAIADAEKTAAAPKATIAKAYLHSLEINKADLNVVRNEMIGWILELNQPVAVNK